ncbi:cdc42 homolog [Mercenaria mercenaria]|uniref:cdc42 homolog n=1 Tax=Mercenaria mercenaria TaxID=6596 RepID=UPI001E1DFDEB|nr:cdc42 homolog [Mercenaria mercenaria]
MIKDKIMAQKVVNCTIIGDGMVGKTSLALAFVNKQPPGEAYVATVFDNYAGTVSVHGEQYTVGIFDSPGQHDYEDVRAFSYRDSEVIIACYSVNDTDSLQNVKDVWIQEAKSHVKRKKPLLLLGCQTDIREKGGRQSGQDYVTQDEGVALAKEIGAEAYIECSSLTMEGVTEVFQSVVTLALKNRKKKSRILNRLLRR